MDSIAGWLTGMQDWAAARDVLRLDLLGKLALATILGGVIGWEREASGKAAGLRTNILICSTTTARGGSQGSDAFASTSCGSGARS